MIILDNLWRTTSIRLIFAFWVLLESSFAANGNAVAERHDHRE